MPIVLIGVGAVLIVLTFLLAFTIYGLISLGLGVLTIALGAHMFGRRAPGPEAD